MTTTEPAPLKTFMGMPVKGEGTFNRSATPQKPLTELAPTLQALLDDPTVVDFGWEQYTPYFNDGDICEFSIGDPWVRTVEDVKAAKNDPDDLGDDGEDDFDSHRYDLYSHPTLGGRRTVRQDGRWVTGPYKGPDEDRYKRCCALRDALRSDAFDRALYEAFGDHVRVRVTREKVVLSEYSHD